MSPLQYVAMRKIHSIVKTNLPKLRILQFPFIYVIYGHIMMYKIKKLLAIFFHALANHTLEGVQP